MTEDNALVSRAKSGDEQAFAELMRAYYAFVYRIVIKIVDNPHDAEEVVQDAFLNAYRGLAQYEDRTKFRSWLAKIARNRALNWQRAQRADTVSINDVSEGTLRAVDTPEERLIRDEQIELVRRAMSTLSQKDRDIARSYYLDGASYDELTRTHGLSYKAISFRLSRAKRILAKRLQYLLTVVFVPPAINLKQISTEGFTAMKIGTVPKITVGVIALIALAFFGSRQLLSPEEDSSALVEVTSSKSNQAEQSAPVTDTNRRNMVAAPSRVDEPQISAEEMGQIEDFFAQLEEADAQLDTGQLTEVESQQVDEVNIPTNTGTFAESTEHSAEEVMNAFMEAFRILDGDAIRSLVTADMKGPVTSVLEMGGVELRKVSTHPETEVPDEVVKDMVEEARANLERVMFPLIRKMINQAEIVSSGYIGDEYHFQFGMPAPEMPKQVPGIGIDSKISVPPDVLIKMRKEDDTWRIYDGETLN